MMEAVLGGEVIARSEAMVVVEGNHYFPPDSVRHGALVKTRMKSLCPWKGMATYFTVEAGGASVRNAAWTYRHPSPLARRIKNHVAFYPTVQVRRAP